MRSYLLVPYVNPVKRGGGQQIHSLAVFVLLFPVFFPLPLNRTLVSVVAVSNVLAVFHRSLRKDHFLNTEWIVMNLKQSNKLKLDSYMYICSREPIPGGPYPGRIYKRHEKDSLTLVDDWNESD